MTYITVKEASEKWNISTRRVCVLCSNNQIPGAVKKSKVWMIPANASKPEDGRKMDINNSIDPAMLILNPTFFENKTNLIPTYEEKRICEITELFLEGNFKQSFDEVNRLIECLDNDKYLFVAEILRVIIAADYGKKDVYEEVIQRITDFTHAGDKYTSERIIVDSYFHNSSSDRDYSSIRHGLHFETMPLISLLRAKNKLNDMIVQGNLEDVYFLEIIGNGIDEQTYPLICAYFHLYLAVFYNAIDMQEAYEFHIRKTADILLPRKWYTPFAEYSTTINLQFIAEIDMDAYKTILKLSDIVLEGFFINGILERPNNIPGFEPEINIQIAFRIFQGKSNKEIAEDLGLSQYTVKKHIDDICAYTNAASRKEIKQFVYKNFFV